MTVLNNPTSSNDIPELSEIALKALLQRSRKALDEALSIAHSRGYEVYKDAYQKILNTECDPLRDAEKIYEQLSEIELDEYMDLDDNDIDILNQIDARFSKFDEEVFDLDVDATTSIDIQYKQACGY